MLSPSVAGVTRGSYPCQRVMHTPLPLPPNGGTRNGEGWKSPDGSG